MEAQNERKIELLQKIKALAERGTGGEKINAQRKLNELMKKHHISEESLSDDATALCIFKFKSERDGLLLRQIMYKVTNEKTTYGYRTATGKKVRGEIGCYVTPSQKIEIEFLFDFYKRLYKKEENLLYDVFIQKHRLFGELKDGEEAEKISPELYERYMALFNCLSDETPLKQIEFKEVTNERILG